MSAYQEHFDQIKASAVGQKLPDVQAEAIRCGWTVRVVENDGKSLIGTCDYRPNRINVSVACGIVTEVCSTG